MKPRVAIACSGLGHVRRGNETWVASVADALHAAGTQVTLLGGGDDVRVACPFVRLQNFPRESLLMRAWLTWHQRYLIEQRTFARSLVRWLREHPHDIVHLADPALAWIVQRSARSLGVRVIYKDGLLLGPPWCAKFDFVQVLAPFYLEQAKAEGANTRGWFVLPHLVDAEKFKPDYAARTASRDAFVVLAVGDFSSNSNKRLAWIVSEVARLNGAPNVHLVLAGQAAGNQTEAFESAARAVLGEGRVTILANQPASAMPAIYAGADAFAHAALREPFGIVFLEAMASGPPVVAHTFPVTRWIVGDGGECVDAESPGAMAHVLDAWRRDRALARSVGDRARARARSEFGPAKIVPLYQAMYDAVIRS
jgi:glycosyltransferase involved in cell wall biosynthesis